MNPVLSEIYSTILPAAPFVIGAYALMFLALFVFVFMTIRGLRKTEQQMTLLEEALAERSPK